ncbi:hypothetical protein [Myroides guanonis]|uniref:Lipocalin-like domain-containing protein n=1 Tax=Myroides guanonis TaxID=1150112 RepID=A0A1I3LJ96_9FLAO|nr:hypothetical protein [Myroides guanonis]SFI84546.1 hypothetical protein SAMN04487893_101349 [Myroides guanonis]
MNKLNIKIALLGVFSVLALGTLATGCSKDDNGSEDLSKGSHYKITATLNNVNSDDDFVSIAVSGGNLAGKTDVWKVNGVVKPGESAIGLGDNDFIGATKTYVIETTVPIRAFAGGVQIINYGESLPLSLKIEKNNETVVNENLTLTGDGADFTKQYSF